MEIYQTEERRLIIEISKLYDKWEQSEINDIEYFELVKERAEAGIKVIDEFAEDIANKYLADLDIQKQDIDELENEKAKFEKKEQEFLDKETEIAIEDIKEQKKIA